jgi:RNA polymerase sigma factor (TIGR02999 family)
MAHNKLRRESSATIDTSALVHEVYLKMQHQHRLPRERQQFLAVAAIVMRRYLVDYARLKRRQKRGGDRIQLTLSTLNQPVQTTPEQILKLDEALKLLRKLNPRHSRIVEFHFFGGYKHAEIAEMLNVSIDTVRKDWRLTKSWLSMQLSTTNLA